MYIYIYINVFVCTSLSWPHQCEGLHIIIITMWDSLSTGNIQDFSGRKNKKYHQGGGGKDYYGNIGVVCVI